MRHIAILTPEKVPRDDEFNFRDRAKALVDKWHQILNANKPANGHSTSHSGGGGGSESGAANGTAAAAEKSEDGGEGKVEGAVTEGTANLDLNGKADDGTFDFLRFLVLCVLPLGLGFLIWAALSLFSEQILRCRLLWMGLRMGLVMFPC